MRRYDPECGQAPYWDEHTIELEPHRSVLEGILQAKARFDGSIGIRCSCRAAICGSCGVRINGEPGLACHTHLDHALARGERRRDRDRADGQHASDQGPDRGHGRGPLEEGPRVTPWLIAKQPVPEREYIVPREAMVDVTQSMACIQCGACVSDCLAMEVDPVFIGPAALAKAYRFVGDPRDERAGRAPARPRRRSAWDLHCTHCFKCVEACPKDVNPMGQIMRLRRIAGSDFSTSKTATTATATSTRSSRTSAATGCCTRRDPALRRLLRRQVPTRRAVPRAALLAAAVIIRALLRRKVTPAKIALLRQTQRPRRTVRAIFDKVETEPAPLRAEPLRHRNRRGRGAVATEGAHS